jgi:hypothetical protein
MKRNLIITAVIAMLSVFMLSMASVPVQAGTNGASIQLVARGSAFDAYGVPLATDIWFSLQILYKSYTINMGNNSVGTALLTMTTYGSGGTISDMSGPVGSINMDQCRFMNVTQLYRFGLSVSSITITAPTGGTPIADPDMPLAGSGLGGTLGDTLVPDPKMTGPNASSTSWAGIAAAVLLATLLIVGLLVLDRKK